MGTVIAIANQKGGVGKTTTTINLAACVAESGHRTLLVDMDPQANATQGIGVDKSSLESTVYDALIDDVPLAEVICQSDVPQLDVVPSNRDLVGAEVELVEEDAREFRLRNALMDVRTRYDYVFVDCPPSLGLLTLNGLVAAEGVVITLQCEYYALEGLSELLRTVKLVRDNLNGALNIEGILLTMVQHTNLSKQVMADVRDHLGGKVYETVIPRNVALSEAPSFGKPIIHYDISSRGAHAYLALASEFISRGQQN